MHQRTWFRQLRIDSGYPRQQDLADVVDVSPELVTMWESGARRPGTGQLIKLDKLMGPAVIEGFRAEIEAEESAAQAS